MQALKSITGTGPVVSQTKQQAAKQLAKTMAKPNLMVGNKPAPTAATPPATQPATKNEAKPVVTRVVKVMTPEEIKAQVNELLDDLRNATDSDEKKKIRRKLRLRNHFGGLGERVSKATKDDGKTVTPPVTDIIKSPAPK